MKKLNFTNPEQSQRLLELGLPADSADCYEDEWGRIHKLPEETLFSDIKRSRAVIPCWSAGTLIDIYLECLPEFDDMGMPAGICLGRGDLVAYMIDAIAIAMHQLDFSKLDIKV